MLFTQYIRGYIFTKSGYLQYYEQFTALYIFIILAKAVQTLDYRWLTVLFPFWRLLRRLVACYGGFVGQ